MSGGHNTQWPDHDAEKLAIKYPKTMGGVSVAYAEVDPKQSPNMRQATRWDYLKEYIGYWIDHKKFLLFAVVFVGGGIWALHVWPPVGLLMIMVGAKYKVMSWMDNFIYAKFGKHRTLVLVD